MLKQTLAAALAVVVVTAPALAEAPAHGDATVARAFIREIQADNRAYLAAHDAAFFQKLAQGQHPKATVVICSDSRVQTNLLDKAHPEGDLFVVRNIGNQLATAKGSVQYGVNHLASSLLLFLGHSSCGAIQAASGDYSGLEPAIQKELDTLHLPKGISNIDGVKANVHNQVAAALQEWSEPVKAGHLLIVGTVYDFADDMKEGAGQLTIINVNGETDPAKIKTALEKN